MAFAVALLTRKISFVHLEKNREILSTLGPDVGKILPWETGLEPWETWESSPKHPTFPAILTFPICFPGAVTNRSFNGACGFLHIASHRCFLLASMKHEGGADDKLVRASESSAVKLIVKLQCTFACSAHQKACLC